MAKRLMMYKIKYQLPDARICIVEWMGARDMSMNKLSILSGVTRVTLTNWLERQGNPLWSTVQKVLAACRTYDKKP